MATKKLKLEEEAITDILVADTDSESGAVSEEEDEEEEGGGGGGIGGGEEEGGGGEEKGGGEEELLLLLLLLQQASAEDKPQAATSGGGLPPWGLPQGRNTNVHPFVGPAKGVKKVRLHTSTKTACHCLC